MLSVLLATHNGADTIERTLEAMSLLAPPAGGWKLVVVNNASTDNTEALVLKWRDRLPLDYVVEPRLGKSVAINTALARAEGDFFVMTDDDVLPDPDWLVEWRRMADAYPQCSLIGGAIVPEFDGAALPWPMPDWCQGVLYGKTEAHPEGVMESVSASGANLALRRSVYDAGWRFSEAFMVGGAGLMGEDTDFAWRLARAGHKVGFAPRARVRHIIDPSQLSLRWMQRRFMRHARCMFMLEDVQTDPISQRPSFRFPWWRIRRAAGSALRLLVEAPRADKSRAFDRTIAITYDIGAVSQAISLLRRRPQG